MTQKTATFRQVFSAEHRILRVRFVMVLSLVFLAVMTLLGVSLLDSLESGFDGNGAPMGTGEVLGLLLLTQGLGWGFVVGMHLYGRCYVVRIFASRDDRQKVYETIGWLRRTTWLVDAEDEEARRFHRGHTRGIYSPSLGITLMEVNAPYFSQRVARRRLPFVIDATGAFGKSAG